LKGIVEELGFDNVVDFYYAIPWLDVKSALKKGRTNRESVDMATCARAHKSIIMYVVYRVGEAIEQSPALPALDMPLPSRPTTMASTYTPSNSSQSKGRRMKYTLTRFRFAKSQSCSPSMEHNLPTQKSSVSDNF